MNPWLNDPEHWRFRAEEARAVAEQMKNSKAQEMMMQVAHTYDLLAEMAEGMLPKARWRRRV